ncbi:hypothetical protein EPN52_05715 [bacterium]|nr:MAG: hypothetical protein EPN52_05715 [bacterium]
MRIPKIASACCALGVCGAIACSVAMFAVPLGIVGAAAAAGANTATHGMGAMTGMAGAGGSAPSATHLPAWVAILDDYGKALLSGSVTLMVLALLFRRSIFGVTTAVIGGLVLYYGMYLQTNMPLMEVTTGFGLVLLLLAMLGLRSRVAME